MIAILFLNASVLQRKALNRTAPLFCWPSNSSCAGTETCNLESRCTSFLRKTRIWESLCTDFSEDKLGFTATHKSKDECQDALSSDVLRVVCLEPLYPAQILPCFVVLLNTWEVLFHMLPRNCSFPPPPSLPPFSTHSYIPTKTRLNRTPNAISHARLNRIWESLCTDFAGQTWVSFESMCTNFWGKLGFGNYCAQLSCKWKWDLRPGGDNSPQRSLGLLWQEGLGSNEACWAKNRRFAPKCVSGVSEKWPITLRLGAICLGRSGLQREYCLGGVALTRRSGLKWGVLS